MPVKPARRSVASFESQFHLFCERFACRSLYLLSFFLLFLASCRDRAQQPLSLRPAHAKKNSGTSLVWAAKRTKQFVPGRPGGWVGTMGEPATTFSCMPSAFGPRCTSTHAVAFSHVSHVSHECLRSAFSVFSFHLSPKDFFLSVSETF